MFSHEKQAEEFKHGTKTEPHGKGKGEGKDEGKDEEAKGPKPSLDDRVAVLESQMAALAPVVGGSATAIHGASSPQSTGLSDIWEEASTPPSKKKALAEAAAKKGEGKTEASDLD
jgi:hypothetical protein